MENLQATLRGLNDTTNYYKDEVLIVREKLAVKIQEHQATAANYANLCREHEMIKAKLDGYADLNTDANAIIAKQQRQIENLSTQVRRYDEALSRKWYQKLFNFKSK